LLFAFASYLLDVRCQEAGLPAVLPWDLLFLLLRTHQLQSRQRQQAQLAAVQGRNKTAKVVVQAW
jgi:hypothetical protein